MTSAENAYYNTMSRHGNVLSLGKSGDENLCPCCSSVSVSFMVTLHCTVTVTYLRVFAPVIMSMNEFRPRCRQGQ